MRKQWIALSVVVLAAMAAMTGLLYVADVGDSLALPGAEPVWADWPDAAPTVTEVTPSSAPNDLDTPIVITGTGFAAVPTVTLGSTLLEGVGWVSTQTLTATVPWGLITGTYTLTVTNPGGEAGSLADAFTVTQGIGVWTTNGPYGGEIRDLIIHPITPTILYAGAFDTGIFVSDNGAEEWELAHLAAWPIHMAFDLHQPQVAYSTGDYGLVRTQDGGQSWEAIPPVQGQADFFYPAPHPQIPGVLYVGGYDFFEPQEDGGFWRSDDWGDSWVTKTVGLTDTQVTAITIHPDEPNTLVVGTKSGNVFLSTDGGDNWQWITRLNHRVYQLAFDWNRSVWAIVGEKYGAEPPFIYTSPYPGLANWTVVPEPYDTGKVRSITFHPTVTGTIWLAAEDGFYSTDWGATWQPSGSGMEDAVRFVIDPTNPDLIYGAAYLKGILKSTDGGTTWRKANEGLGGVVPHALAVSPFDPQEIYVSAWSLGILRTANGGESWQEMGPGRLSPGYPQEEDLLAFDPFVTGRLYLGTDCSTVMEVYSPCVQISVDGAQSWTQVMLPNPGGVEGRNGDVYAVAPDPNRPGRILAGVAYYPNFDNHLSIGKLFTSNDYGVSWTPIAVSQPMSSVVQLEYDAVDPDLVYAATNGTGLWKSTDGGENWQPVSSWPGCSGVTTLVAHPQESGWVYVRGSYGSGCDASLYFSDDAGASWTWLVEHAPADKLIITPEERPVLYAGSGDGLYRSLNGGYDWIKVNGLPEDARIYQLGVGASGERVIVYAATSAGFASSGIPAAEEIPGLGQIMGGGVYRFGSVTPPGADGYWVYLPLAVRR